MKGHIVVISLMAVLFAIAAGCSSAPAGTALPPAAITPQETRPHYVVGVDGNFPPFTSQDAGGNFTGFDIEAARWIADREGFDIEFVAMPWDRIVPALDAGSIDLIWSGTTVTEKRRVSMNFSRSYLTVNQSIAARTGSNVTLQDVYDGRVRIGAQAGSTEADWVTDNLVTPGKMPAANLTLYPDITTLTDHLVNGTVDVSIIQTPSQQRAIAGRPLAIIGTTPEQEQYAVAVRKTDTALLARVNDGLTQLQADPAWTQLKQKYGLEG